MINSVIYAALILASAVGSSHQLVISAKVKAPQVHTKHEAVVKCELLKQILLTRIH